LCTAMPVPAQQRGGIQTKGITMKSIASYACFNWATGLFSVFLLAGCTGFTPSVGVSFPIGGIGSVGVSVGADGRVGGTVGVGVGAASVNVGTSGQLPIGHKTDVPTAAPTTPLATTDAPAPAAKTDTPAAKTDTSGAKPAP
jgi:hypothetical protein